MAEHTINFTDMYMPTAGELSKDKLQQVRQRLVARERLLRPDLDTRPNSVYGDLFLDPAAETIAAIEVGLERFAQDLDPQNPANGKVFNCDFVEAFLSNFGVDALELPVASGYVRLSFVENKVYEMPKSVRFQFNNTTIFYPDLPLPGGIRILPQGVSPQPGVNSARLVETQEGVFETVIRVVSNESGVVAAGTTGTINIEDFEGLNLISAEGDFRSGEDPVSLSKRAQNVRVSAYSASPVSRGGTQMLLSTSYPDLSLKSATFTGDNEVTRNLNTILGAGPAVLDVNVRRPNLVTRTDTVRVPYLETDAGNTSIQRFLGPLNLSGVPILLHSIRLIGESENLRETDGATIWSRSKDSTKAPGVTCSYSMLEELWLDCPVTFLGDSPSLEIRVDEAGNQFGVFDIEYTYDPSLEAITHLLEKSGDMPWLDTLVRGGVPVNITKFEIQYFKSSGVQVSTAQARDFISKYVNSVAHPRIFQEGPIFEEVYYAGAEGVQKLEVEGTVQYTVADRIWPSGASNPADDYAAALGAAIPAPSTPVTLDTIRLSERDPDLGTSNASYYAVGPRNIHYIIDKNIIVFDEQ